MSFRFFSTLKINTMPWPLHFEYDWQWMAIRSCINVSTVLSQWNRMWSILMWLNKIPIIVIIELKPLFLTQNLEDINDKEKQYRRWRTESTTLCWFSGGRNKSRSEINLQAIACLIQERAHIEDKRFVIGRNRDFEIAHNRHQRRFGLCQCEFDAGAHARSLTEWQVECLVALLHFVGGKSRWIEHFRFGIMFGIPGR